MSTWGGDNFRSLKFLCNQGANSDLTEDENYGSTKNNPRILSGN